MCLGCCSVLIEVFCRIILRIFIISKLYRIAVFIFKVDFYDIDIIVFREYLFIIGIGYDLSQVDTCTEFVYCNDNAGVFGIHCLDSGDLIVSVNKFNVHYVAVNYHRVVCLGSEFEVVISVFLTYGVIMSGFKNNVCLPLVCDVRVLL